MGHGVTTTITQPTLVQGLAHERVMKVACSYFHTIAVTADEKVYAFGRNDLGQLGSDDGIDKHTPHPVSFFSGIPVLAVACGQYHTVASLGTFLKTLFLGGIHAVN